MLKKMFIKDYNNVNDKEVRIRYARVSGFFGIITNLILGIIKLVLGIFTHSISILTDSINNISDMFSSILTIIGFILIKKKPNKSHPYGYARYEYIFGLLIAIVMLLTGIILLKESILKLINPSNIIINIYTYIVLVISIFLKTLQMFVYTDFYKAIKSNTLKANSIDTRNDILTSLVLLISMIIMQVFNINVDGLLGVMLSIFIIYSSYRMISEVIEPLIGIKPTKDQIKQVKNKLLSYDYVLGVHDLVIHNYGVHNDFITVHVEIDSSLSLIKAHDLIDVIENDFKENMNTSITIHIDPVIVGNKKINKLKEKVLFHLKKINKEIDIHDFRLVEGKKYIKVLFDCVLPFDIDYNEEYLEKYLKNSIKDKNNYQFIIEIDRPFC